MVGLANHLRNVVGLHAQRLIDSHFGNDAPRPKISIPAQPDDDTDLIVSRGIRDAADEIDRLRHFVAMIEEVTSTGDGLSADLTIKVNQEATALLNAPTQEE